MVTATKVVVAASAAATAAVLVVAREATAPEEVDEFEFYFSMQFWTTIVCFEPLISSV